MAKKRRPSFARDQLLTWATDWALRALGPLIGGVAGVQAYLSSQNLTLTLVVSAFVFGMVSFGINHASAFWRERSLKGKLRVVGAGLGVAKDVKTGEEGLQLQLHFQNLSPTTHIALVIDDFYSTLNDVRSRDKNYPTKELSVSPGLPEWFKGGLIPIALPRDGILSGVARVQFRYGHPGFLNHTDDLTMDLHVLTDGEGKIKNADLHRKVGASDDG